MCLSYLIIFRHITDDLGKCKIVSVINMTMNLFLLYDWRIFLLYDIAFVSVIWLEYYPVIWHCICFCYMIGVFSCYKTFFLAFDFCRFCMVIRFFHPRHNGQWPQTSKDFYIRSYPLHYFLIFLLLWHWICLPVWYMKVT